MAVPAVVGAMLPFISELFDRLIPDKEARAKAKQEMTMELIRIEAEQRMEQVKLNQVEAQHASIFVAGWRPFIGWVGGVSLLWTFLLHPFMVWTATVSGYEGTFPLLDTEELMALVMAMLGIGAMRSFDKMNGVATSKVGAPKPQTKPTYNE